MSNWLLGGTWKAKENWMERGWEEPLGSRPLATKHPVSGLGKGLAW